MKLANGKKSKLLEYLMIIVGTGLMSLAINSVFDQSMDKRNHRWRNPSLGNEPGTQYPAVSDRVENPWFFFCKESIGRRNFSLCMACTSAGVEPCR